MEFEDIKNLDLRTPLKVDSRAYAYPEEFIGYLTFMDKNKITLKDNFNGSKNYNLDIPLENISKYYILTSKIVSDLPSFEGIKNYYNLDEIVEVAVRTPFSKLGKRINHSHGRKFSPKYIGELKNINPSEIKISTLGPLNRSLKIKNIKNMNSKV